MAPPEGASRSGTGSSAPANQVRFELRRFSSRFAGFDSLDALPQFAMARIEEPALPLLEMREFVQLIQVGFEQLALEERLKVLRQKALARRKAFRVLHNASVCRR